jgi:hypothetical protein
MALLAFSMLALASACGSASSSGGASTRASSSPAPSSPADGGQLVVSRAIQAQNQLHDLSASVQSATTTQGSGSFTTQGKIEWTANPERFYAKTSSSLTNRETEVIVDTPTQATYVNTTGAWIKTPLASAPQAGGGATQASGFVPALKGDAFKGFSVVGKETVAGKPTWHLSGPMPFTSGAQTGSTVANTRGTLDVWVGQNDYRLVKQAETLESTDGSGFAMKATVLVDSVDSGLTIPLPKPA